MRVGGLFPGGGRREACRRRGRESVLNKPRLVNNLGVWNEGLFPGGGRREACRRRGSESQSSGASVPAAEWHATVICG